jgi:hypothetical protein
MIKSALRRIFIRSPAGLHQSHLNLYLAYGDQMKTINSLQTRENLITTIQSEDLFCMNRILSSFDPIGLSEMDKHSLQDRVDTKFLLDAENLPEILAEVQSDYSILEINGTSIQAYITLYFDTLAFDNYFAHHNGKRPRFKIRMRKYMNSNNSFLEVKEKDNKDHTIKTRMGIKDITNRLSPEQYQFISGIYNLGLVPLKPVIWNRYNRMTLVSKRTMERVTIDLNFNAYNQNGFVSWDPFAIAEVKQGNLSLHTEFCQVMKNHSVKPVNFSKYCISMALLTPQLKSNRFKANIETIKTSLQRRMNYAF